jgi:hypothetical protein
MNPCIFLGPFVPIQLFAEGYMVEIVVGNMLNE